MPRQARIYFPGGVFHIISRCVAQEFLLEGAPEREYYLRLLAAAQKTHDARVLAWCIMSIGLERSPILSGHEVQPAVREIASALGDLNRPSGAILGSDDFIEEVLNKTNKVAERVVSSAAEPSRRAPPPIESLIDVICAILGIEPEAFEESRSARGPALARRLLTRAWVREYKGKQADLARYLDVRSSIVSRWHSRAIAEARSHGDIYERVVNALPGIETQTRPPWGTVFNSQTIGDAL